MSAPGWGPQDRSYGVLPPVTITDEEWMDALGVLPPAKWRGRGPWESFHISEYCSGNIVSWYVRYRDEAHFKLQDVDSLTPEQLIARCEPLLTTGAAS
jgi:hypothetical protein